jgi:hypothetical protein
MRTHTLFIDFDKLARTKGAIEVSRVAMVCNDLAIANSSMRNYSIIKSGSLDHIRRGGLLYFVRMSCGHLNEGMNALEDMRKLSGLSDLVGRCSTKAQSAFVDLCKCLRGGSEKKRFQEYVGWIRNRIAFHYSAYDVRWAVENRAKRHFRTSSITGGPDIHSSRFEFGDVLLDTIVCRQFWNISMDADVQREANRIGDWCFQKSLRYLEFGGEFVPRFLREHKVIL